MNENLSLNNIYLEMNKDLYVKRYADNILGWGGERDNK